MKKFNFISDFDNTISNKDFYWIIIDDYIGKAGVDFYTEWKKTKKIGSDFLNQVFAMHQLSQAEHDEALSKVTMDEGLSRVVDLVEASDGDFHILSAGFDYYIKAVLQRYDMTELSVHTNKGVFEDGYFKMCPDPTDTFYSPLYGIDKEKVALHYKKQCEHLIFAGDSEPDFWAARHADVVFAKEELARIMDENGMPYIPYSSFDEIYKALTEILKTL